VIFDLATLPGSPFIRIESKPSKIKENIRITPIFLSGID